MFFAFEGCIPHLPLQNVKKWASLLLTSQPFIHSFTHQPIDWSQKIKKLFLFELLVVAFPAFEHRKVCGKGRKERCSKENIFAFSTQFKAFYGKTKRKPHPYITLSSLPHTPSRFFPTLMVCNPWRKLILWMKFGRLSNAKTTQKVLLKKDVLKVGVFFKHFLLVVKPKHIYNTFNSEIENTFYTTLNC